MRIVFLFLMITIASVVFSQQKDSVYLKKYVLKEVVISANKWQQQKTEIPSKIISISKAAIAFQNPQTSADVLQTSGSVFVQKSQQGGGSPMIRGFATNRLLYSVDGVRMNTAIFRSGNLQNVISIDPFVLDNVEVLLGANSVIYGSDAIGGVMRFQTVVPSFSTSKKTQVQTKNTLRYATANKEKTGHFSVGIGTEKWASYTAYSYTDFDDLQMGKNGPSDYLLPTYVYTTNGIDEIIDNSNPKEQKFTGYLQHNITQKIRFLPNKKWEVHFGLLYSETSPYGRFDKYLQTKENNQPAYAKWNYGPQKWLMNNLSTHHHKKTMFYDKMVLQLAYQRFEESRITRKFNQIKEKTQLEKVDAYSINTDFNKRFGKKNRLFYGSEFVFNNVNSTAKQQFITTGEKENAAARYPQSTWQSIGFYLSNLHHFSKKTQIQTGVRYNIYTLKATYSTEFYPFPFTTTSTTKSAITGSLGWTYKPTKKWRIATVLATAFRAPNVDDVGKIFDSEPGAVVVPNPNLKAEYAYSVDVNITKQLTKNIIIESAAFYTLLDNAMVRRDFTLNGNTEIMYDGQLSKVQAIQNAAQAKVYGFQLAIMASWSNYYVSSILNFQKGEEELDNGSISVSRHTAPLFGTTKIGCKTKKITAEVYLEYNKKITYNNLAFSEKYKPYLYAKDAEGKPYSPGWHTINVKTKYQITPYLQLSLGIENIANKRYKPYSSGIAMAERNYIMSCSITL